MAKCLCCFGELQPGEVDLHKLCIRRLFSAVNAAKLPYTSQELEDNQEVELSVDKESGELRFVDGAGEYSMLVASGEEALLEAVTMRMADIGRIAVTPHSLIRTKDGILCHLRRAVNHGKKGTKIEVSNISDTVQGDSYEVVAEKIIKSSTTPKLDLINLYERLLFGYLVGATELNLDSFKMAKTMCGSSLAPALSIMPNSLITKNNEMAMSLAGKRGDFTRSDFEGAMLAAGIEPKIIENIFAKFEKSIDPWCDFIDSSELSDELKDAYKFQIVIRFDML